MKAKLNTIFPHAGVFFKMPKVVTYILAAMLGLVILDLSALSHALENKTYPDLNHRIRFRGSDKACHYQLTYKGSSFNTSKKILSSHSSFLARRIARKTIFLRQAFFPITPKDLFILTHSGEAKIQNTSLTKMVLKKILQAKNASDLRSISSNLKLIISSTSKINPIANRKISSAKLVPGIYWRDQRKKTLFALASLESSSFALVESCYTLPRKGITKVNK